MKILLVTAMISIVISSVACTQTKTINHKSQVNDNGIRVTCNINKVQTKTYNLDEVKQLNLTSNLQTFIYGVIDVKNLTTKPVIFNIEDYKLLLGSSISSKIYIDSVADIIINKEVLTPNGHSTKKVYWVFPGNINTYDINKIQVNVSR
ncbi:MAG: hypothetical protein CXR30_16430 [Geobacter sp.]|nr:MAG: hypothetical protein CXR30_16430 [Geobacter sp.]